MGRSSIGGGTYNSAAALIGPGQGASPPVLTIYNLAIPGAPAMYLMGSSFMVALGTPGLNVLIIA